MNTSTPHSPTKVPFMHLCLPCVLEHDDQHQRHTTYICWRNPHNHAQQSTYYEVDSLDIMLLVGSSILLDGLIPILSAVLIIVVACAWEHTYLHADAT